MKMNRKFVSKKALKHSDYGTFKYDDKKLKMQSGGHGQSNILFLRKRNIAHNINIVYNNGVRLGNVLEHMKAYKRKNNKQAWFPTNWTKDDIKKAGLKVINLKKNQTLNNNTKHQGTYKKVKVGVYTNNRRITTIFPIYDQKGGIKYDNR